MSVYALHDEWHQLKTQQSKPKRQCSSEKYEKGKLAFQKNDFFFKYLKLCLGKFISSNSIQ